MFKFNSKKELISLNKNELKNVFAPILHNFAFKDIDAYLFDDENIENNLAFLHYKWIIKGIYFFNLLVLDINHYTEHLNDLRRWKKTKFKIDFEKIYKYSECFHKLPWMAKLYLFSYSDFWADFYKTEKIPYLEEVKPTYNFGNEYFPDKNSLDFDDLYFRSDFLTKIEKSAYKPSVEYLDYLINEFLLLIDTPHEILDKLIKGKYLTWLYSHSRQTLKKMFMKKEITYKVWNSLSDDSIFHLYQFYKSFKNEILKEYPDYENFLRNKNILERVNGYKKEDPFKFMSIDIVFEQPHFVLNILENLGEDYAKKFEFEIVLYNLFKENFDNENKLFTYIHNFFKKIKNNSIVINVNPDDFKKDTFHLWDSPDLIFLWCLLKSYFIF